MERARQSRLTIANGKSAKNRRVRQTKAAPRKPKAAQTRRRKADPKVGGGLRGDRKELFALAFLALSLALGLALSSHGADGENLIGVVGRFAASRLFASFGLGSFVLPVSFFLAFVNLVRPTGRRMGLVASLGYVALLVGAAILVDLLAPAVRPFGERPGGALGGALADSLEAVLSTVGSVILVVAWMAAALVVAAGLKVSRIALAVGSWGKAVGAWTQGFVRMQFEQHLEERYARLLEEEERRAELELEAPAPRERVSKIRFRRKRAEEGTLEADLDGRIETPQEEEAAPAPAPILEKPKPRKVAPPPQVAAPVTAPAFGEASTLEDEAEPAQEEIVPIPPDPAWARKLPTPPPAAAPLSEAIAIPTAQAEAEPEALSEPDPEPEGELDTSPLVVRRDPPQVAPPEPAPVPAPAVQGPEQEEASPVIEIPKGPRKPQKTDSPFDLIVAEDGFSLPPLALLDAPDEKAGGPIDEGHLHATATRLRQKLEDFGIKGQVERIRPGPVVTMYEFAPAPGVKISRIQGLSDDLAMALEALRVRIVAPIPGRGVVGIEVPNAKRETVYLREVLEQDAFRKSKSKLTMGIGKDIEGMPFAADLAKMPHLLIAGTTGSGKSVSVNSMIMSLLFKSTPEEVRFIMVDPKMLELSIYEGIPHLLLPVVTDPRKAALALRWAVDEMERRYALLAENGVRDLAGYNRKIKDRLARLEREGGGTGAIPSQEEAPKKVLVIDVEKGEAIEEEAEEATPTQATTEGQEPLPQKLPYLVIIIDELADLMMVASKEVEMYIARIAQKARAAGIHLMVATQRPSVDVVTGLIKANFPSRVSFLLRSRTDSMTILDSNGAEKLLGQGDMLILPPTSHHLQRVHGALVTETEIQRVVDHLKAQGSPVYDESILEAPEEEGGGGAGEDDLSDDLYDQAVAIVSEMKSVSISMLQRRMRIGYNRSARMIERMEREGVVGPADGARPREVLISAVEP